MDKGKRQILNNLLAELKTRDILCMVLAHIIDRGEDGEIEHH